MPESQANIAQNDGAEQQEQFEYPLRGERDHRRFFRYLFIWPSIFTVVTSTACGYLLFNVKLPFTYWQLAILPAAHFAVLMIFLSLLWIPAWLAVAEWGDKTENSIYYIRNFVLLGIVVFAFPHLLIEDFVKNAFPKSGYEISMISLMIIALIFFILAVGSLKRTALRDIQAGKEPRQRKYSEKWLWFNSATLVFLFIGIFIIELWFMAALARPVFSIYPHEIMVPFPKMEQNLPLTTCALFAALVFFLWAGIGNRLMKEILIPVTFHERDIRGLIFKAHTYLREFVSAVLLRHPFLIIGGIFLSTIILLTPLILVATRQPNLLTYVVGADQLIWTIGIFIAWFGPIISAIIHPDETYGQHFNQRLTNLLMMVQGHIVVVGFGNLGKRVIDREIKTLERKEDISRRRIWHIFKLPRKYFLDVVTPDVRLERICTHMVIVEREPADVVYSAQGSLLGAFGVVAAGKNYKPMKINNTIINAERRVLVPVIIGEAREPFVSSRVNLERAVLIISTIPEGETVQKIFDRASASGVNAIISVSRTDQIAYLTYRSRHRPIVLVYPKHNQGSTLGHGLWAAMLKVRSFNPQMDSLDKWPRVLIVGNSKAYRFMIETLWTYLPGDHQTKLRLVEKHFAFIVTTTEDSPGHPELKEKPVKMEAFDMYWPESFLASGRFPQEILQPPQIDQAADDDLPPLNLNTRLVNEADTKAISECINDHRPHILLINHDDFQKTSLMLLRCMRSIEKLKMRNVDHFHLPLILLSAAQGDDRESYVLGDASRFYDALCKFHNEKLAMDHSYPSHSRFDHFTREIVGETISDSLSDAEEIIAGARRSFSEQEEHTEQRLPTEIKKQFIEITSCLPNTPGALAEYLAKLAGLKFEPTDLTTFKRVWKKVSLHQKKFEPHEATQNAHLPSFQHLRHVKLNDPEQGGFALTGYAALVPINETSSVFKTSDVKISKVARIYANDGRHYVEKQLDPKELEEIYGKRVSKVAQEKIDKMIEPSPPGVPNVIDKLTARSPGQRNTIAEYRQTIFDYEDKNINSTGKYACPGMNLCRIAAFQDYVSASNNMRLAIEDLGDGNDKQLLHARNYHCCPDIQRTAIEDEQPDYNSAHARIFCCARGPNMGGMISMVLNILTMRFKHERLPVGKKDSERWLINIDYFNHLTCQNSNFTLNRLFGVFSDILSEPFLNLMNVQPLHTVRILPIGSVQCSRLWYNYALALYYFMQEMGLKEFKFYWVDEKRKHREISESPSFNTQKRKDYPILLVIKKTMDQDEKSQVDESLCRVCRMQKEEFDCSKFRVWV